MICLKIRSKNGPVTERKKDFLIIQEILFAFSGQTF